MIFYVYAVCSPLSTQEDGGRRLIWFLPDLIITAGRTVTMRMMMTLSLFSIRRRRRRMNLRCPWGAYPLSAAPPLQEAPPLWEATPHKKGPLYYWGRRGRRRRRHKRRLPWEEPISCFYSCWLCEDSCPKPGHKEEKGWRRQHSRRLS